MAKRPSRSDGQEHAGLGADGAVDGDHYASVETGSFRAR